MECKEQQRDIETLLAGGSRLDEVFVGPRPRGPVTQKAWGEFSPAALVGSRGELEVSKLEEDERSERVSRAEPSGGVVTVRGRDIGDLPTEYDVVGLTQNELPVIGTYVDPRICVGFSYRVRVLGTETYLFDGKALPLQSIGMGYGKRLTFKGEKLNSNLNYFYSDTQPTGYGFTLVPVQTGDRFDVCDEDNCTVGVAKVMSVDFLQAEKSDRMTPRGGVAEKHVGVSLTCDIGYQDGSHGLLNLQSQTLQVCGIATVLRRSRAVLATTAMIKDVLLPGVGLCRLYPPSLPLQA